MIKDQKNALYVSLLNVRFCLFNLLNRPNFSLIAKVEFKLSTILGYRAILSIKLILRLTLCETIDKVGSKLPFYHQADVTKQNIKLSSSLYLKNNAKNNKYVLFSCLVTVFKSGNFSC